MTTDRQNYRGRYIVVGCCPFWKITISSSGRFRIFSRGWPWKPDESWGGLGLRDNFMHMWIRT